MAPTLAVYWRDIPARTDARDGGQTHKVVLHPRFQVAIDRATMKAGKADVDDDIGESRRASEPRGDDVEAAAAAPAAPLEADLSDEVLARLAANGGVHGPSDR